MSWSRARNTFGLFVGGLTVLNVLGPGPAPRAARADSGLAPRLAVWGLVF